VTRLQRRQGPRVSRRAPLKRELGCCSRLLPKFSSRLKGRSSPRWHLPADEERAMPDGAMSRPRSNLGVLVVTHLLRRLRAPSNACTGVCRACGVAWGIVLRCQPQLAHRGLVWLLMASAAGVHLGCATAATPSRGACSARLPLQLEHGCCSRLLPKFSSRLKGLSSPR
jgi:hypothetical protein